MIFLFSFFSGFIVFFFLSVDDFRGISMQMLKSHFGHHQEEGRVGRVEYLPVLWHSALHGDATGVDRSVNQTV